MGLKVSPICLVFAIGIKKNKVFVPFTWQTCLEKAIITPISNQLKSCYLGWEINFENQY